MFTICISMLHIYYTYIKQKITMLILKAVFLLLIYRILQYK